MKKKILTIMLIGIIVLGITGCSEYKNKFKVGEKSDVIITNNEVSFTVKKETLTNIGATFVLKNNSDIDVQYREKYELEIKQSGEWHKVNINLMSGLTLYSFLKSGEVKEFKLNWEEVYGKLASGTYRIIRDISYEKEKNEYDKFYIAAEFTIE